MVVSHRFVPAQAPAVHLSSEVSSSPSSQTEPSLPGFGSVHSPVSWTQVPAMRQGLSGVSQMVVSHRFVPAQTPAVHTSPMVALSPSSHSVPFCFTGFLHPHPFAASVFLMQYPTSWHWLFA